MHSIQMSKGARGAPWKPVPKMASTTTSLSKRSCSNAGRGGATTISTSAASAFFATMRARSPLMSSGVTGLTMRTATPCFLRTSAATQPSPPLLPRPAKIVTLSCASRRSTSWAAAAPARCMSSERLTPTSVSISSTRRTSSMFSTGCMPSRSFWCAASCGARGSAAAVAIPLRPLPRREGTACPTCRAAGAPARRSRCAPP